MAVRSRFTRIPKVHDLILAGVPTEAIPTYCALADHANNKTGLCWPRMETLARRLRRSPRTVQRHLHLLKEKGLVEFVERRRDGRGRFGTYVYKVLHIVAAAARKRDEGSKGRDRGYGSKKRSTTGHGSRMAYMRRTKRREDTPLTPQKRDVREGFWWLFDEESPPAGEEDHRREVEEQRQEQDGRRREGYEWLFE